MIPFLELLSKDLLEKYKDELHNICIVTPNRRSAVFLNWHLGKHLNKPSLAPEILSMEEFISQSGKMTIQDPVILLLDFYRCYKASGLAETHDLEEFLRWAPVLLRDFNEIDNYVESPEQLFNNLTDIKRIENWNPENPFQKSEYQIKLLAFYEQMKILYKNFRKQLSEDHLVYPGLAARILSERKEFSGYKWKKIIFAGLNALSQAQEKIVKKLKEELKAEMVLDTDKYYMSNKHEAGLFINRFFNKGLADNPKDSTDHFRFSPKNINIYGVARSIGQVKLCADLLSNLSTAEIENNDTAVILADETLLLPMLHSLPKNINHVNVTMGYPLQKTNLYGLMHAVFQMFITVSRLNLKSDKNTPLFYHKDLLRIIRHPIIRLIWDEKNESTPEDWISMIAESNSPVIATQRNKLKIPENLAFLFTYPEDDWSMIIDLLQKLNLLIARTIKQKTKQQGKSITQSEFFTDFEALFEADQIWNRMKRYMEYESGLENINLLFSLFQTLSKESKISIRGEPLLGLQVMGMLETRALDFKNIYILQVNEGLLPLSKPDNSFIPTDLKRGFGIPVFKEKDAIFAYHFYRLLQRAENIHLFYNTETQSLGVGEKSRFISQIQMELPLYNPAIKIKEFVIPLSPDKDAVSHAVSINKSEDLTKKLNKINESGFSPSALQTYVRCSLLFYFRYIAELEETQELEETIKANTLGSVVHEVLEDLYKSEEIMGKKLREDTINQLHKRVEEITKNKFNKLYKGGDITTGKNHLIYKTAIRYVHNFLHQESKYIQKMGRKNLLVTFLKSEHQLKAVIKDPSGKREFFIKGVADRIDKVGSYIRIIDYKTGVVNDSTDLTMRDPDQIVHDPVYGKILQLLTYALLYKKNYPFQEGIFPGIISLRQVKDELKVIKQGSPRKPVIIDDELLDNFEKQLLLLLNNIFDTNIPFSRTEDTKQCRICEFKSVCHRQGS